ncbi:MAG: ATP-dependent nuclease [Actinomycetota bacterium]
MKLQKVAIRRYRSIEEMDAFEIEPDVTCLVGKNESGKTAVLQALNKSHSHDGAKFDEGLDYPTTRTSERRKAEGTMQVTTLSYHVDDSDVQAVEDCMGKGALSSRMLTVKTRYDGTSTWVVELDEEAVVRHLARDLDLPAGPQQAAKSSKTVSDLVGVLEGLDDPNGGAADVLSQVAQWRDSSPMLRVIDLLNTRRPKFVYFGEYDSMPGEINVKELIARRDAEELNRGQRAFLSLLHLASVEPEDFISPESDEHLIRDVENASNGITEEVFTYWSQNTNLRVQLRVGSSTAPPYAGPTIQIRVLNQKHHVTVPFDERSRGFVWFFSFLAYFSEIEQESSRPLILLLDEPGLSLHAKAQADLLRFIDERLAPEHQVIFTTHSPFMVDSQKLHRVRTVEDREEGGTTVSADVLKADSDTVFPLMAAMGIDLTQTLWVGPNVLLVEGPSDVVFLTHLSEALRSQGREGLDLRWVVTPGGGLAKLPSFLSLFGANKMNIAVLTDSSPKEAKTIQRLKELGRLGNAGIVQMGEILDKQEADLEDLFTGTVYLKLVNEAYQGVLKGRKITVSELSKGNRLTSRIEEYFAAESINGGRFNHYAPAGALMRGALGKTALAPSTLDHAEKLMRRINSFLPVD